MGWGWRTCGLGKRSQSLASLRIHCDVPLVYAIDAVERGRLQKVSELDAELPDTQDGLAQRDAAVVGRDSLVSVDAEAGRFELLAREAGQ